jgi:hypothetical protein
MANVLKGNYDVDKQVAAEKTEENLGDRFEKAALARLGGSIGFVARKRFVWHGDGETVELQKGGRASQYDKD